MLGLTAYLVSFILLFLSLPRGMEESRKAPEYEFRWVRDYGEEIEDVAWGMTGDGTLYPKVFVFEKEARFYDEGAKVSQRLTFSERALTALSPRGEYLGVTDVTKLPTQFRGESQRRFALYDAEVSERTRIEFPVSFNGEQHLFCLSDLDGIFVEIYDYERRLRFYDLNGNSKKEVCMFHEALYSDIGFVPSFTKNGEFFGILACESSIEPPRMLHHDFYFIFFRRDGTELWRRLVQKGKPGMGIEENSLRLSSEGNYVLVATAMNGVDRGLMLFDGSGTLVRECRGWLGRFSDDERYLVICGRNEVRLIETESGNVLWEVKLPWNINTRQEQWRRIADADISEHGDLIAILSIGYQRYANPDGTRGASEFGAETALYDRNGELLHRENTDGARRVRVSRDGNEVRVLTRTSMGKIEVHQEGR